MIIQAGFDIKKCLDELGFKDVDKSQESLAVKNDISVYYFSNGRFTQTYQLSMIIKHKDKTVYDGLIPANERLLIDLLDLLFPSDELLVELDGYITSQQ